MKYLFATITFFFFVGLKAQEATVQQKDLKVGVVLSGGGAKGLAHIGALKEIEKAGIRVDYIGGTSMGAIIGALYASGYSATQLDSIFNTLDFETLIRDDVPRSAKTFYEKDDAEKYALTFPFDDFQLRFPSGISKGQNVYNLLSRLLFHVRDVENFDELPIPFVCIATDVEKGKQVVFRNGYLPKAITASGAIPSLFSPIVIDDVIYVDGGVLNNYPVDEVKAMGADVIIGVDVQDTLRGRDKLRSAVDVLVQVNNYRTIEGMIEKRKKTDVYINPKIDDFSVVSFGEGRKIIAAGEKAAKSLSDTLQRIASLQKETPKKRRSFSNSTSIFIEDVVIIGNQKYTRSYILGKLKLRTPSEVSYTDFSEGVNNLSATGNFAGIDYHFQELPGTDHKYKLVLQVLESGSRTSLRVAAQYDQLFHSAGLANITRKRLFTNNDVASLDLIVGDNLRYNFDYYIDKGYYWSIGLSSSYSFFDKNVAIDFLRDEPQLPEDLPVNRISLNYTDLSNEVFVQTVFQRVFSLELGAEHKWLKYLSETIGNNQDNVPRTVFENTHYGSAFGRLKYDSFDDSYFPSEGFLFSGDFHWYLLANGDVTDFDPYSIAKAKAAYAHSLGSRFAGLFSVEGGVKFGNPEAHSLDFFIGGYGFKPLNNIIPMIGYEPLELRGDTYLKSDFQIDFEFAKKNHLILAGSIANVGNNLFGNGGWIDGVHHSGMSLGYGLETFFGPMELKYAYSPDLREDAWYVSAGFRF